MKRVILFAICILAGCISAKSQVKDSIAVSTQIEQVLTAKDSTYLQLMKFIAVQLHPRFKMYKTENIYNLIKLDTATGALWQERPTQSSHGTLHSRTSQSRKSGSTTSSVRTALPSAMRK